MLLRRNALQQCLPCELAWHARVVTARIERQGRQEASAHSVEAHSSNATATSRRNKSRLVLGAVSTYPRGNCGKALSESNTLVVMPEPQGRPQAVPVAFARRLGYYIE